MTVTATILVERAYDVLSLVTLVDAPVPFWDQQRSAGTSPGDDPDYSADCEQEEQRRQGLAVSHEKSQQIGI